ILFKQFESMKDVREQGVILVAILSMPQPEGDNLLAKALASDKLRLGDRLEFLDQLGSDPRTYLGHASALKRLAGSQSEDLRGMANLALKRGGMPCDHASLRAFYAFLSNIGKDLFDRHDNNGLDFTIRLQFASKLALCTDSLSQCITEAWWLVKA